MARFDSNESFPRPTVLKLRELGHDVLTALEAGNANLRIADEAVLRFAIQTNRTLLTLNRKDFIALHSRIPDHCGIVVCSVDADSDGQADRIHQAVSAQADVTGVLIRVNRPQETPYGARSR
jgi:hypothetical protein